MRAVVSFSTKSIIAKKPVAFCITGPDGVDLKFHCMPGKRKTIDIAEKSYLKLATKKDEFERTVF